MSRKSIISTPLQYMKKLKVERTQKHHIFCPNRITQKEVKVSANSKASIRMHFDYSDADELQEGNFIEGYITLKEKNRKSYRV